MADSSFAAHEVLDKLLADSEGDFLRDALTWLLNQLMDAAVSGQIGALLHERSASRTPHRNGSRRSSSPVGGARRRSWRLCRRRGSTA